MEREDLVSFYHSDLPSASFAVFEDMRKKEELCDVTVKIGNLTFIAHKVVLAAVFPYFRSVFTSNGSVSEENEIAIGDLDPTVLESLIHFAYSSRINISTENVLPLLVASELLQLEQVKDACVEFLSERLDVDNVVKVRTVALSHSNRKLIESTNVYIRHNFEAFCESEDFLHLSLSCIKEIISGDDLKITGEEIAFEAVMKWAKFLPSERGDFLPQLLSEVRMVHLPINYLINRVASEELIRLSIPCMHLMQNVQSYHLLAKQESFVSNLKTQPRTGSDSRNGIYALCHNDITGYSIYYCNLIKQTWESVKSKVLQPDENLFGAAAANESIYLFLQKKIARFQLKALQWETLNQTHEGIGGGTFLSHQNKVFCFGSTFPEFGSKVRCFDTRTGMWLEEDKMTRRSYCSAASFRELVYVTGGQDSSQKSLSTAEQYNPVKRQWSVVASMLEARECHGCACLNGKIYVCGGYNETQHLNTTEVFDPLINKWNFISPKVVVRGPCSLMSHNNNIFAFRHNYVHDETRCNDFELYDPETGHWEKSIFSAPRGFLCAVCYTDINDT